MAFLRIPRRPNTINQRMDAVKKFGEAFPVPVPKGLEQDGLAVNFLPGNKLKPVPVFKRRRREIGTDDL